MPCEPFILRPAPSGGFLREDLQLAAERLKQIGAIDGRVQLPPTDGSELLGILAGAAMSTAEKFGIGATQLGLPALLDRVINGRFCGVPDGAFDNVHIAAFGSPGGRWDRGALTYQINPGAPTLNPSVNAIIAGAFQQWQNAPPFSTSGRSRRVPTSPSPSVRRTWICTTGALRSGLAAGAPATARLSLSPGWSASRSTTCTCTWPGRACPAIRASSGPASMVIPGHHNGRLRGSVRPTGQLSPPSTPVSGASPHPGSSWPGRGLVETRVSSSPATWTSKTGLLNK